MTYKLQDLIDLEHFQNLQDRLNKIYAFPSSIIDNDGNILTATAWQEVCTHFHRKNKEAEKLCIKSDQYILSHLHEANPAVSYRCAHGLTDNATPIIIDGIHYGNFFTGQFFLEAPNLDFFRSQAKKYGFDEKAYVEAVKKVPIWTQEQLNNYLFFIKGLIAVISESGLKRLKEIENRKQIEENEKRHRSILKTAIDGFIMTDSKGKIIEVNEAYCIMSGYSEIELLTMHISDLEAVKNPQQDASRIKKMNLQRFERIESKHRRRDGSVFDVEISVQFGAAGEGPFVSFVRDITDRKQAEEALRDGAAMMKSIFKAAPVGIGVVINRVFQNINDRFCEMTGYSRDELIGQSSRIIYPDDAAYENVGSRKYEQILKKGTGSVDTKFKRKDGKIIDVVLNSTPLDPADLSAGVTFTALDITERKQAEQALVESEHKWRNILVSTPQIGVTLDTGAHIIFANEHLLNLTGWKEQEVIGQNWFDLFIPEHDRENVRNVFHTVMDQKDTLGFTTYENEIVDRSGNLINVAWSNALTKDTQGNVLDVTCLGVDLTERRRSEEKLKESEAKYRTMMEAIKDPIYICSEDYRVQYLNQAMLDRVGYNPTGEYCYKALHGFNDRCPWCDYKTTAKKSHTEKNIISPKDNRSYNVSSTIFKDAHGALSKISVFRDTTELIALQNRLQQAQKMESIGNLAGGIAHDFNNILFPIIGMSELLLEDLPPDSLDRENAEEIYKAGKRGHDLVKQILAFSRQSEHKLIPTRIQNVLKEVIKLSRATIPSFIEIKHDIQQNCGMVMADPSQIHQVGMNIITNAYHAVEDTGGEISIRLKQAVLGAPKAMDINVRPGSYVVLTVSDTGHGMSQELIQKIFEPYYTTKAQGKGTGLGLAVVYGIVQKHKGAIKVFSKIGKGSTFEIYLPLMEKSEKVETIAAVTEYLGGNERILLVDDDESVIKLEKQILERLGYRVTSHLRSIEALEAFKARPYAFDLAITDMSMPDIPGDQLSIKIKAIRPQFPIIICTGFSEKIHADNIKNLGIDGLLMKPIEKSELADIVRKVLDAAKSGVVQHPSLRIEIQKL